MEHNVDNYTILPPVVKFGPKLRLARTMQPFLTHSVKPDSFPCGSSMHLRGAKTMSAPRVPIDARRLTAIVQ